jgi:hypothetical protein
MSYGLPLKDEDNMKLHAYLHSIEETIFRKLRACKAQPPSKKKQIEGMNSVELLSTPSKKK